MQAGLKSAKKWKKIIKQSSYFIFSPVACSNLSPRKSVNHIIKNVWPYLPHEELLVFYLELLCGLMYLLMVRVLHASRKSEIK